MGVRDPDVGHVGNGLRFRHRFLVSAVAMAFASFGLVVFNNDYWAANAPSASALLLGLVAITMYLSRLLLALTRATSEARRANEAKMPLPGQHEP